MSYTEDEENLIVLSSFARLTYQIKKLLLSDFESSVPDFAKHENFLIKTLSRGVYNKVRADFSKQSYRAEVLNSLKEKGIECVTYFSPCYPDCLKYINEPPVLLYCRGDISLLKTECFSIVGSRRTTPKGLADCKKIAGEISEKFTVVTGLAEGADANALEGALEADGKVISVLANGLDRVYPACNAQLLKRVESNGLVVTEYPPDELPQRHYFLIRNRIIAGLSRGTLVVSAGKRSGALNTANHAVECGRDVFAFPYSLGVSSGEGCNSLIKNGAYLVENILDIFSVYGLDFNRCGKTVLSDEERTLYSALKAEGDAMLAVLADRLNKQPYEIIPVISSLEIKGLALNLGGNRYCALDK